MNLEVIVLAAGLGKRMRSAAPKVLHRLGGRALLAHVIGTAETLGARSIHVVHGHGGEAVRREFDGHALHWVEQPRPQGTGQAVALALPAVDPQAMVAVMYGDVPLISCATLRALIDGAGGTALALLTARPARPAGLGRIIRDSDGRITAIREERDASAGERAIGEINTGFIVAPAGKLREWLARVDNDNAQDEYYLTDAVALAVADGVQIVDCQPSRDWEVLGVNSKTELAELERIYQRNQAVAHMEAGVTIRDPERFDLRGSLIAGADCEIDVNVVLEGTVELGDRVRIAPNCVIRDSRLGNDVTVEANTLIEQAQIESGCHVGPFARLRPDTHLGPGARIGNFVEVKKSAIGPGSKANHLAYIGDSRIGAGVNVGAGVITCNYDGVNKHQTVIGDNAFIGSHSTLVAPVSIGRGAYIAAGSTINKDAPDGKLTVARARQQTLRRWRRPAKTPAQDK